MYALDRFHIAVRIKVFILREALQSSFCICTRPNESLFAKHTLNLISKNVIEVFPGYMYKTWAWWLNNVSL